MVSYIGTKNILAKPITKDEYNIYRGWELPADENGSDEGFLVEYTDGGQSNHPDHKGYISWSPKDVFDRAYRETDGMTFGMAIEALKLGKAIARKGWNGKGMFIFKQIPAEISLDIIPKLQSVPQVVKDKMIKCNKSLKYTNQMAIVNADGRVDSWVASSSDIFAEDWYIVE